MESKLHWDRDKIDQLFNPFQFVVGELRGAIWMFFHIKESYDSSNIDKESKIKNDDLIYDKSSNEKLDDFSQKINDMVQNIEKFIASEMKRL